MFITTGLIWRLCSVSLPSLTATGKGFSFIAKLRKQPCLSKVWPDTVKWPQFLKVEWDKTIASWHWSQGALHATLSRPVQFNQWQTKTSWQSHTLRSPMVQVVCYLTIQAFVVAYMQTLTHKSLRGDTSDELVYSKMHTWKGVDTRGCAIWRWSFPHCGMYRLHFQGKGGC